MGDSFWVKTRVLHSLLPSVLELHQDQIYIGPVHADTVSEFNTYIETVDLGDLVFLVISILTGSFSLSLEPWQEGFEEDISFRTEYAKVSYSLHLVQLWASVFIPIYCFSDDD